MQLKVYYSIAQVHRAAYYIWENNPYVRNWPNAMESPDDVVAYIKTMMFKQAEKNAHSLLQDDDQWVSFTGTGGFLIHFTSEYEPGDGFVDINVEVSVDPAVGISDRGYTEKIFELD